MEYNKIICGDTLEVLKQLPDEFVDCVVTSPPYYGLRDYGVDGQLGLEKNLNEYLDKMLLITGELKRVLKKSGTMWWNHGDSYGGLAHSDWSSSNPEIQKKYQKNATMKDFAEQRLRKGIEKCMLLQNYRLVLKMIDEQQWILRNTIIWHKPNCMPSSVKDRFTVDYEPVFFFSKSKKYWFETQYESNETREFTARQDGARAKKFNYRIRDAIRKEGQPQYKASNQEVKEYGLRYAVRYNNPLGRGKRSVWKIATKPYSEAHFATFPPALIETPIKAGCPKGGLVLDPFMGSGTTAFVARSLGRNYLGIELNKEFIKLAEKRLIQNIIL